MFHNVLQVASMKLCLHQTGSAPIRKAVGLGTRCGDPPRSRSAAAQSQTDGTSSRYAGGALTPPKKLHSTDSFRERRRQVRARVGCRQTMLHGLACQQRHVNCKTDKLVETRATASRRYLAVLVGAFGTAVSILGTILER